jgi:hypothetical protein
MSASVSSDKRTAALCEAFVRDARDPVGELLALVKGVIDDQVRFTSRP